MAAWTQGVAVELERSGWTGKVIQNTEFSDSKCCKDGKQEV